MNSSRGRQTPRPRVAINRIVGVVTAAECWCAKAGVDAYILCSRSASSIQLHAIHIVVAVVIKVIHDTKQTNNKANEKTSVVNPVNY